MRYCYKVLYRSKKNNKLYSCCRNINFPRSYITHYLESGVTTPRVKNTKLFVFETLKEAKEFAISSFNYDTTIEVWRCHVANKKRIKHLAEPSFVTDYWKYIKSNRESDIRGYWIMGAPNSSCAVDSVELVSLVYSTQRDGRDD